MYTREYIYKDTAGGRLCCTEHVQRGRLIKSHSIFNPLPLSLTLFASSMCAIYWRHQQFRAAKTWTTPPPNYPTAVLGHGLRVFIRARCPLHRSTNF